MAKISTGRAAKRAGVSDETIRRAIKRGRIPATETPGGHYRVEEKDVDKSMASSRGEK